MGLFDEITRLGQFWLNQQKNIFQSKMVKKHQLCGHFKSSLLKQRSGFFGGVFSSHKIHFALTDKIGIFLSQKAPKKPDFVYVHFLPKNFGGLFYFFHMKPVTDRVAPRVGADFKQPGKIDNLLESTWVKNE